jgi:hypothetical protein
VVTTLPANELAGFGAGCVDADRLGDARGDGGVEGAALANADGGGASGDGRVEGAALAKTDGGDASGDGGVEGAALAKADGGDAEVDDVEAAPHPLIRASDATPIASLAATV